jgi:hypothetical protein
MAVGTPDSATQVEDRIKADVQREAPDSNPYLAVHWLRSLIAGVARRIFDFYLDLSRTETRLMPDTADAETAPRWGNIFVGPANAAANSSGQLVATGTVGGAVPIGASLTAGGKEFTVTLGGTITLQSLVISSITRSGGIATVTTVADHNLSSFVPVTISGAVEPEYNAVDAAITVTGPDSFTYPVTGSPSTPATGTLLAGFTTANVTVASVDFGADTNLAVDTPVALQSPIVSVDNTLYVTYGAVGGGTDAEATEDYVARYLDKIRNPVAHFNAADIIAKAKEVPGVTRVFVQAAGTEVGTVGITSITRSGNVATVITDVPHGFEGGQTTSILGAVEPEYNVTDEHIIVEDASTFHYVVVGTPSTPATGTGLTAATSIPLGQVSTYFMRDNDADPIPVASEVLVVKAAIDSILPANTSTADNFVSAPSPVTVDYTFTALAPDTTTMRAALNANLQQFHDEQVSVGVNVDEDAYRAAIKNTVDPDTGDIVQTFVLSAPTGDITINAGEIAVKGTVAFP